MSIPQVETKINTPPLRSRNMLYEATYPQFYRDALDAETEARREAERLSGRYLFCADHYERERRWLAYREAQGRHNDASLTVNALFLHWQALAIGAAEECECTPERVCRSCQARARLDDQSYEPNMKELEGENV